MHSCPNNDPCEAQKSTAAQIEMLNRMAFQSMREASEYGSLIQFIKTSFEISDHPGLLKAFFACTNSYSLNCTVQIRSERQGEVHTTTFNSETELASAREEALLSQTAASGRIVDLPGTQAKRTIFNDKHVSFLVKNMPDDPDDFGRKKDVLAVLLEGFEARVVSMKKQDALRSILRELIEAVNDLSMLFNVNSDRMIDVMETLMVDMNNAFHTLALTEEQEDNFTRLVDNSIGQLIKIHTEGRDIEDKFTGIIAMANSTLHQ